MATATNTSRLNPAVHEIKVSRSDFLADVTTPLKRPAYVYAECAVAKEEGPTECGLIGSPPTGGSESQKAKRRPVELTAGAM